MCSTRFNEWFFTPEGDRIPRDTKPTYWHHPALDNSPGSALRWLKERGFRVENSE
jgi:predicted oxidoreductase